MRYLIVSDLHGSVSGMKRLSDIVKKEKPDVLWMLGDMLHGAHDEDDRRVAFELKTLPCGLVGVRGNCDFSSDEKLLNISLPMSRKIDFGVHSVYLIHRLPSFMLPPGDVLMYGHTHYKRLEKIKGSILFNPGSIGLPRDDGPGYGVFDEKRLILKDGLTQDIIRIEDVF